MVRLPPSHLARRLGAHMLRNGVAERLATRGTGEASVVVGLGVFQPRGTLKGNGRCCAPRCDEDEQVWAAWLWNGDIVALPFCLPHAQAVLELDELAEAQAIAALSRRPVVRDPTSGRFLPSAE